jgi:ubiquitin-like modifier-activating enzyme ATG7
MLRFEPLSSHVEPSFWQAFADRKINLYKLDDSDIQISGSLIARPGAPSRLLIGSSSFDNTGPALGIFKNTNTIEEFKAVDKMDYLNKLGLKIWTSLNDCWETPSQLVQFGVLSFADLKKYKFLYWFAFPALMPAQAFLQNTLIFGAEEGLLCKFDEADYVAFAAANPNFASFFLVKKDQNKLVFGKLSEYESINDSDVFHFKKGSFWVCRPFHNAREPRMVAKELFVHDIFKDRSQNHQDTLL